jgi:SAM-dependent methyltransferase
MLRLTEPSRRWLSADSPDYQGFSVLHTAHIMGNWLKLDQAVRSGTRPGGDPEEAAPEDEWREAFLMAMFNVARQQADRVAAALDRSSRTRLLDLGGGPGTYAVHFCLRYPRLRATVFDRPGTEKFARSTFERFGLGERLDFVGGDFLDSSLPGGFDAVWLSQVLHGEGPAEAARLVGRGADSLTPGGLLAVQEFIVDDGRQGPAMSTLFALNMLVQTSGGQSYTDGEIRDMMLKAGLSDIRRLSAELPPGCGILTGLKR